MEETTEEMVKRLAHILGSSSASQNALDKAVEYQAKGWAVKYYFTSDNFLVVEGIDPEDMKLPAGGGDSQ